MEQLGKDRSVESSATQTLAILSGKGGTGKSILSTSLGYLLARIGFRTLLVDMDFFTGGLSFYALAEYPRRPKVSLKDVFTDQAPVEEVRPVEIPHPFARGHLYILPAVTGRRQSEAELQLHVRFQDLEAFVARVQSLLDSVRNDGGFDLIILDTRGGSDLTSVGAALAAGSYILVTEADKTSWDVGRLLIDAVEEGGLATGFPADRLGFVINKNVLPSQAIEAFLRQQWECPHLTTIPLDENAIRFFQEDRVPVAEDIGTPFSAAVIPIIRKLFVSEDWSNEQIDLYHNLEFESSDKLLERIESEASLRRANRFTSLMRIYGGLLSLLVLGILASRLNMAEPRGSGWSEIDMGLAFLLGLWSMMLLSEPKLIGLVASFLRATGSLLLRPPPRL
jgi:MinD-like ATPase involved in chromosome partitioning or flagellar assembly